jgi:hypothetical protein
MDKEAFKVSSAVKEVLSWHIAWNAVEIAHTDVVAEKKKQYHRHSFPFKTKSTLRQLHCTWIKRHSRWVSCSHDESPAKL